ncbi:biogenesis of lysosome-related organelles complex 1 subunit 2 [Rhinoraja longicauda]
MAEVEPRPLSGDGGAGPADNSHGDGGEQEVAGGGGKRTDDFGVETAEEATEPSEPDINELCKEMFTKMSVYLQGELTATCEDYKLLENMNKVTGLKYLEMKEIAVNINRNLKDLNQKYASLQPYLDQIGQIEEQVAALEQAAYRLDAYSKKLEAKFKKLEKR